MRGKAKNRGKKIIKTRDLPTKKTGKIKKELYEKTRMVLGLQRQRGNMGECLPFFLSLEIQKWALGRVQRAENRKRGGEKYNEENKNSTFCRKTERGVAKKRRKKEKIES